MKKFKIKLEINSNFFIDTYSYFDISRNKWFLVNKQGNLLSAQPGIIRSDILSVFPECNLMEGV